MTALKAKKPIEITPGHFKGLFFGKPGAGKTWLALNFPAPYYVDVEGGSRLAHYAKKLADSGGAYFGPDDGANDFEEVIEQVKSLATEKHAYRTLIIDSVSKLFNSAISKESEKLGAADVFGKSKKGPISQMRRLLSWIEKADINCILIAHSIQEWGMVNGQRQEIGEQPDCWNKLPYELDLVAKVEHQSKGIRIGTVTKSRLTGFPEYSRFDIQNGDKDVGYENFASRYGKDYIEADAKPVEISSPDQVAEIERLVSVLKVEEGEVDKILSKANADSFADLTSEQAEKLITYLTKKIEKPVEKKEKSK